MLEHRTTADVRDFSQSSKKIEGERRKTPQEIKVSKTVLAAIPKFIKQYGGVDYHPLPSMIHFVDSSGDSIEAGYFDPILNNICINSTVSEEQSSPLELAQKESHELLHFSAYHKYNVKDSGERTVRRMGLVFDGKDVKASIGFYNLNEALTEELNKRFDDRVLEWSGSEILKSDLNRRRKLRFNTSAYDENGQTDIANYDEEQRPCHYAYRAKREVFVALLEEIARRNKDKFIHPEEVFNIFAKAYFTGKVLDLARLMESTFGKGSFRRTYDIGWRTLVDKEDLDEPV